jgi:hypothetical protein
MDHSEALRLKATEKYLLNELDPERLDEFEEHMFDCPECAIDVRAAAMFVEQSKVVLSEVRGPVVVRKKVPIRAGWLNWLRPEFAAPALALLLVVVGYQNFFLYPRLQQASNTPQAVPWATINLGVYGADDTAFAVPRGKGFVLLLRIPPEGGFTGYAADLYTPAGKLESTSTFAVSPDQNQKQDRWAVAVPATDRASGTYTLKVHGTTTTGEVKEVGQALFDVKIQQ